MTSTTRRRTDQTALVVLVVLAAAILGWVYLTSSSRSIDTPATARHQVTPVVDEAGSYPAGKYVVDTTRPAVLVTSSHRFASFATRLEIPLRATAPDKRLPEIVDLDAALSIQGVRLICTKGKIDHPGTVQYPERVVVLDCGAAIDPASVDKVTVYRPGGWIK